MDPGKLFTRSQASNGGSGATGWQARRITEPEQSTAQSDWCLARISSGPGWPPLRRNLAVSGVDSAWTWPGPLPSAHFFPPPTVSTAWAPVCEPSHPHTPLVAPRPFTHHPATQRPWPSSSYRRNGASPHARLCSHLAHPLPGGQLAPGLPVPHCWHHGRRLRRACICQRAEGIKA